MVLNMFRKKQKKILSLSILSALATSVVVPTTFVATQNSNISTSSVIKVNTNFNTSKDSSTAKEGYDLIPIGSTGISLKVPNYSVDKQKADKIASTYSQKPSSISTTLPGKDQKPTTLSIYNILDFGSKWNDYTATDAKNKPTIINLGNKNSYSQNFQNAKNQSHGWLQYVSSDLTNQTSLPAFDKTNDGEQPITQEYLDNQGVLTLQLSVVEKNNSSTSQQKTTYYVMISGFGVRLNKNSASESPQLAGSLYAMNVNAISNQTLLDNIVFDSDTNLHKQVGQDTRINNSNEGSITFTGDFSWFIPPTISFASGFPGLITKDNATSIGTNNGSVDDSLKYIPQHQSLVTTTWERQFVFKGFQPSPNISNTEVVQIVVAIICSTIALAALGYGATKISKHFWEKRSM